jgi:predicted phosphodiesterase
LDALIAALDGVERLVLLGDVLELRSGPQREAVAAARPVFARLGAALGDRPVILVPGNHDHALIAPWLERRAEPLGLSHAIDPADASEGAAALASALGPAPVEVRYPGIWLRDDTYATHGHYLDCHITVPSVERLAIGAMGRLAGHRDGAAARASTPDDYERLLGPLYAWINAVAQSGRAGSAVNGGVSGRAWRSLRGAPRASLRRRALGVAWPAAVAALNRAGLGPLRSELSGGELRRAGLRAMFEVIEHLGIRADHVLFGHTHRAGPLVRDRPEEWRRADGTALLNTGCWVYETTFLSRIEPENPYWPGSCAVVDDDGAPPRLERLLGAELASAVS